MLRALFLDSLIATNKSSSNRRATLSALAIAAAAVGFASSAHGQIVNLVIPDGYHSQVTDYFCGAASMEMELDTPAVLNNNIPITNLIAQGDGNTVPDGAAPPAVQLANVGGVGVLTSAAAQTFIYNVVHSNQNTFNNLSYSNPFWPAGKGTDTNGLQAGLNILDNPTVNNNGGQFPGVGSHAYASYNLLPTFAGGDLASRTIASALTQYNVPAVVGVESGAHYISVYGVSTNGVAAAPNANYSINGFLVHDPWTGYAVSQFNQGNAAPAAAGGFGLGFNTYLRYGYDIVPGGVPVQLPNGNIVPIRPAPWFQIFNPSGNQGAPAAFTGTGYKFEVEPQGPELPDTGDNGLFNSLPAAPTELSQELNASGADSMALTDLAANPTLQNEPGLIGGSFDTADESLMTLTGDVAGQGDWLIPYDGAGGINDVTGAVLIDAATGVLDAATWMDPSDPIQSMTLAEIDQLTADNLSGLFPNDNNSNDVPEPASIALLVPAAAMLLRRTRRST